MTEPLIDFWRAATLPYWRWEIGWQNKLSGKTQDLRTVVGRSNYSAGPGFELQLPVQSRRALC